jgi:hypothetical protein
MRAMLSVLAYDVSEKDPDYARIQQDLDVRLRLRLCLRLSFTFALLSTHVTY